MVDHQPSVRGKHRRGSTTDFKPLPFLHRAGQSMMGTEVAQMMRLALVLPERAVRDPNTLTVDIHNSRCGVVHRLVRMRSREERPMKHRRGRLPMRVRNRNRKEQGILVIDAIEIQTIALLEHGEVDAVPVEQIFRQCQRNSGAVRRECSIRHHILLEWLDKSYPRVFASTATARTQLIVGSRLQRDPQPFDPDWVTLIVETYPRDSYSRIVALSHQPRKKVEMAIRTSGRSRVQSAFHLQRIAGLRRHDHSDPV